MINCQDNKKTNNNDMNENNAMNKNDMMNKYDAMNLNNDNTDNNNTKYTPPNISDVRNLDTPLKEGNLAVTNSATETTISNKPKRGIDPKGKNVIKIHKRKRYSSANDVQKFEK
jgi:hypothetical protein